MAFIQRYFHVLPNQAAKIDSIKGQSSFSNLAESARCLQEKKHKEDPNLHDWHLAHSRQNSDNRSVVASVINLQIFFNIDPGAIWNLLQPMANHVRIGCNHFWFIWLCQREPTNCLSLSLLLLSSLSSSVGKAEDIVFKIETLSFGEILINVSTDRKNNL